MDGVTDVRGERERAVPPQAAALRRLIDGERHALDQSLDRLGERIQDTLDWRQQAARHRGVRWPREAAGVVLLGVWRAAPAARAGPPGGGRGGCGSAGRSPRRRCTRPSRCSARWMLARGAAPEPGWWSRRWRRRPHAGRDEVVGRGRTVHARPRPAEDHAHEEERWRLEKRMS